MRFPGFCSGSYQSESINIDCQRSMNLYPESNQPASASPVALYQRAGKTQFADLITGPVGGLFKYLGAGSSVERVFAVATEFSEIFRDGSAQNYTFVTTALPVTMEANNSNQICICTGGALWLFNTTTGTAAQVATNLGVQFTSVGFLNGFFLALQQNSQTVWFSAVEDGTTWPALNFFAVNQFADNVLSMLVDHGLIWLFGPKQTAVYYNTSDFYNPFLPATSQPVEQGIAAPFSVVKLDNSIFWLGADERGRNVAWKAYGYTPTRVSTHAIETEWQKYTQPLNVPSVTTNIATIAHILGPSGGLVNDSIVVITPGPPFALAAGTTVKFAGLTAHPVINNLTTTVISTTVGSGGNYQLAAPSILIEDGYFGATPETGTVTTVTQTAVSTSDAIGYAYQENGHPFWVLYFPTANKTWVFDAATQLWHERSFWNGSAEIADRARCHVFAFGQHLLGDTLSGKIWAASTSITNDFGNPIVRYRRAPHITAERQRMFHKSVQLDIEPGQGPTFTEGNKILGPSAIVLQDPISLNYWTVTMDGNYVYHTTLGGSGQSAIVILQDSGYPALSWQLGVNVIGQLTLFPGVTWGPYQFLMTTTAGTQGFIQVTNGWLQAGAAGVSGAGTPIQRGPLVYLRWSDDGGHTWKSQQFRDAGAIGKYAHRLVWHRLGRSRDRVYEVGTSEDFSFRIVDAYLWVEKAQQGPQYA